MINVSAPGKIHLIGEHAVVYGKPAILASVSLRCYVHAEKGNDINLQDKKLNIDFFTCLKKLNEFTNRTDSLWKKGFKKNNFSELFSFIKKKETNLIKAMIGKIYQKLSIKNGIKLIINSEIPIASGLGSSSALSVALTKAVSELYKKNLNKKNINKVAFECEKFSHGNPSGGDNSASCFGGLIWFQKPDKILSLKNEIPYELENFVIVYTKKPEKTTGELVQLVKTIDIKKKNKIINCLGKSAFEMKHALIKKDFKMIKKLMNLANQKLSELNLSIPETKKISKAVKDIDGGAKMCGSCCGGIMLCYHENKELLLNTIKKTGFNAIECNLSVEGVRKE